MNMGLLKPFVTSPKQLEPELSKHSPESASSPSTDDNFDLDVTPGDREVFSCELEPENGIDVSLVLFQRSELLYFAYISRAPEAYSANQHKPHQYDYAIDMGLDLLYADYTMDGTRPKESYYITILRKSKRRKLTFPFLKLEDAHRFQQALLGWRVVMDEAHVHFKFNHDNKGDGRVQLWQETPMTSTISNKTASDDELPAILSPALMLYSKLWDEPRCIYTLMQEGFRAIPSHRDCQHSKEDVASCTTLYIAVLAETPRKFTVYVNAGSNPFDLVPFRKPVGQRFHSTAKLSSDCLRLTFDNPQARNTFASHLRYLLGMQKEMISERRFQSDQNVRMHGHYMVPRTQRHGPPGGKLVVPSSTPRPRAHISTSTTTPEAPRIGPMDFEEGSSNLAVDEGEVLSESKALPAIRRRTSISTMSTMSIPAPPYALFEDAQSSGSHYR